MELIHKFGLEPSLFLFQTINFLIIAFILKKFLFNPLKKMFDERKHKVEQCLQDVESARIALENANEEKQHILEEAENNAGTLIAAVKVSIEETKEQAAREAKDRSEQIVYDAKQKVAAEFENMSKQIGKISADISGKVISRVLSNLFTDEEKQKLISRALEKIDEKVTN